MTHLSSVSLFYLRIVLGYPVSSHTILHDFYTINTAIDGLCTLIAPAR